MANSIDIEPGRTRDKASKENQDRTECQSFPTGSVDSAVGDNSRSQPFDEQSIVRQPQPGEQFQVVDPLAKTVSITTSQSSTVRHHNSYGHLISWNNDSPG